jgi:hypothetical protein
MLLFSRWWLLWLLLLLLLLPFLLLLLLLPLLLLFGLREHFAPSPSVSLDFTDPGFFVDAFTSKRLASVASSSFSATSYLHVFAMRPSVSPYSFQASHWRGYDLP